jgi:hypothetical protein
MNDYTMNTSLFNIKFHYLFRDFLIHFKSFNQKLAHLRNVI